MTSAIRLVSTNTSPKIRRARKPTPLISSEARRKEQTGQRFYERANLKPCDLPPTYLSLTSYKPRVERRSWRWPAAVIVGAVFGLVVLGATGNAVSACIVGLLVGVGVLLMERRP